MGIELKLFIKDAQLKILKSNSEEYADELNRAIKIAANNIRSTAIKNISHGSRTGRLYKRGSIRHVASDEGEWPKSDTGILANSIRVNASFLEAEIGSDVNYSEYLEKKDTSKGGRPWLSRAYDDNKENIAAEISHVIKRTFRL